mmetsp:Transcript_4634/g.9597  ORF Transcript_4634/g.9597 Transcript_4634/m.9597 type:complete len:223 (+) Transcript_4634:237-905(+)
MDTQSLLGLPTNQSWMWSTAAEPAEAAEEAPRTSMISAPLFCTRGRNSLASHSSTLSPRASLAATPSMVQLLISGYMVGEWLPQMTSLRMVSISLPDLSESWARARLWSRRVMAVKFSTGMLGAWWARMRALVLAGLPTTTVLQVFLAVLSMAAPVLLKMAPLSLRRSARSIPGPRGLAPTRMAASTPSKPFSRLSVSTIPFTRGKAASLISIAVPLRAFMA